MGTLFDGKSLIIVTGTTRGLGQEIVKQFSQNLQEGSHVVLVSKSSELKTKTEVLKTDFPKLIYYAFNCDLSNLDEVMKLCDNLVNGFGEDLLESIDNLAIVHNSGSIGKLIAINIHIFERPSLRIKHSGTFAFSPTHCPIYIQIDYRMES